MIDNEISKKLENIFDYIGKNYGITMEEWNHDIDYVQVHTKYQYK